MFFISYWILPLISACVWLAMLLALFVTWITQGSPHYPSMEDNQHIAYISDVGAEGLKPLFIAGCVLTTVFLDLSFAAERWLRHTGRLAMNTTTAEKVLSVIAIIFGVVGTVGLILLSIFDTLRYPHLHDGFLLMFIAGYVLSAIFICAEYQRLGIHQRQYKVLRVSFWIKLVFIVVEIGLAIGFGVCTFTKRQNVGAVLEWSIALIFTLWVLSFFIDLLPAVRTKRHGGGRGVPQVEVGQSDSNGHIVDSAEAEHDGMDRYVNGRSTNGGGNQMSEYGQGYQNGNGHAIGSENGYLNGAHKQERPVSRNF